MVDQKELIEKLANKEREIFFQVGFTKEDGAMDYIINPKIGDLKLRALTSYLESIVEHLKESLEISSEDNEYESDDSDDPEDEGEWIYPEIEDSGEGKN